MLNGPRTSMDKETLVPIDVIATGTGSCNCYRTWCLKCHMKGLSLDTFPGKSTLTKHIKTKVADTQIKVEACVHTSTVMG